MMLRKDLEAETSQTDHGPHGQIGASPLAACLVVSGAIDLHTCLEKHLKGETGDLDQTLKARVLKNLPGVGKLSAWRAVSGNIPCPALLVIATRLDGKKTMLSMDFEWQD